MTEIKTVATASPIPGEAREADLPEQVCRFLAGYFSVDDPAMGRHTLLVDDLGADSLDLLQVAHNLNEMFDIDIDVDTLPQLLSVGGACDLVVQRCAARRAAAS